MTEADLKKIDFSQIRALPMAYAHNALPNPNQFWDAFLQGYTFLEADIHLVNNQLIVSHELPTLATLENTLEKLYLDPLFDLFQQHHQSILPQFKTPIQLMIDIKTDGRTTYQQLLKTLIPYQSMLTNWQGEQRKNGAVTIMISGNRPMEEISKEHHRIVCVDGRLKDIGKGFSNELMPMISDRFTKVCWRQLIGWNYSKREIRLLNTLVQKVHNEGKEIRFWRTPEDEKTWQILKDAGVDWIGTDKIDRLAHFLNNQ